LPHIGNSIIINHIVTKNLTDTKIKIGGIFMGSSGSGTFGNYKPGSVPNGMTDTGDGIGGGIGKEQNCPEVVENINLEDVATSQFYVKHKALPPAKSPVRLRSETYQNRMVVEVADTGEILGNLPTQYHTLLICMKRGMKYEGIVLSSGLSPIPFAVVTLYA
jgi:hypothetical protein